MNASGTQCQFYEKAKVMPCESSRVQVPGDLSRWFIDKEAEAGMRSAPKNLSRLAAATVVGLDSSHTKNRMRLLPLGLGAHTGHHTE